MAYVKTYLKVPLIFGRFRCGVRLAIRERKQTIKLAVENNAGSKTCLSEAGLGMRYDIELGRCTLGAVGKGINNDSGSSNNVNVFMSDETLRKYSLDRPGEKGIDE